MKRSQILRYAKRTAKLCVLLFVVALALDFAGFALRDWARESTNAKAYCKSVHILQAAVLVAPLNYHLWVALCDAYLDANEPVHAVGACRAAVKLDGSGWSNYDLGLAYSYAKDYDHAASAYGSAIAHQYDDPVYVQDPYVRMLLLSKRYQEAAPAARRLIASTEESYLHPYRDMGYQLLGIAYEGLGEMDKAHEAYHVVHEKTCRVDGPNSTACIAEE